MAVKSIPVECIPIMGTAPLVLRDTLPRVIAFSSLYNFEQVWVFLLSGVSDGQMFIQSLHPNFQMEQLNKMDTWSMKNTVLFNKCLIVNLCTPWIYNVNLTVI